MTVAAPDALSAESVSVELAGNCVLVDFSLRAAQGTVTALVGPNGAGKSSALKALAGLLPCAGTVHIHGQALRSLSLKARARQLAYVPQQSLLQRGLSVRTVVSQGRYAHDPRWPSLNGVTSPAVDAALAATHVSDLAERRWDELSGGEQRRVLLARALATEAPIVLLDEPTASLDVAHSIRFLRLLGTLARSGRCIVVVLHDLEQARCYADRALLLSLGRTVASGPVRDVISNDFIRRVYGVELAENAALGFRLLESEPR